MQTLATKELSRSGMRPWSDWCHRRRGVGVVLKSPTSRWTSMPSSAIGYSQHEGAERAGWTSSKLTRIGGTHPVVYPAAGSHGTGRVATVVLRRTDGPKPEGLSL